MNTNEQPNQQPTIIRTERGLTVAGTRITLYAIMDFIKDEYPPHLIRHKFYLTEQQMADVLTYLNEHRDEVETEYQQIIERADELRLEHEEELRQHLASRPSQQLNSLQTLLHAKRAAGKASSNR